jgi:hypothetical protein
MKEPRRKAVPLVTGSDQLGDAQTADIEMDLHSVAQYEQSLRLARCELVAFVMEMFSRNPSIGSADSRFAIALNTAGSLRTRSISIQGNQIHRETG